MKIRLDKKVLKKCLIVLTLISCVCTIYEISNTYALLHSETNTVLNKEIGKWNILLNNKDITNGLEEDIVIDNLATVVNNNVAPNKLAPGVTGSIELTLDPQDTDVSVRYDITLKALEEKQITLSEILLKSGSGPLTKTGKDTYTGVMPLAKIKNDKIKDVIRITVFWENNEENNDADTVIGTSEVAKLELPIKLSVRQYLGEEITEYVPEEDEEESTDNTEDNP